jgi:hypothetical protein
MSPSIFAWAKSTFGLQLHPMSKKVNFSGDEELKTRVTDVSNEIRAPALLDISQHSANMFDKCLRIETI